MSSFTSILKKPKTSSARYQSTSSKSFKQIISEPKTSSAKFQSVVKPKVSSGSSRSSKSTTTVEAPTFKEVISVPTTPSSTMQSKIEPKRRAFAGKVKTKRTFTGIVKRAPRDIATGVKEVGQEIFSAGVGAVKGSYNYGFRASERANRQGKSVLSIIGKDILGAGKKSIDVAKFVKENPKKSALIVGATATAVAGDVKQAFADNPVKATTKGLLYLFPNTTIKGVGKAGKLSVTTAKKLKSLAVVNNARKTTAPLRPALTAQQNAKLTKIFENALKINKSKKALFSQLNTFINSVAKQQQIKLPKTRNISQKIARIKKESKVIPIGEPAKLKLTKKQPTRPIKLIDLKKKTVKRVSKVPQAKPKRTRDKTKFFKVDGIKIARIKKGEFLKNQPRKPKKQPTRPVKFIDLEKKRVSKISQEASKYKPSFKISGKKGQARLQFQFKEEIKEIGEQIKKLKKIKSKKKIKALDKKISRLQKTLTKLRALRFVPAITLLSAVSAQVKELDKIKKPAQRKKPSIIRAPVQKRKPSQVKRPAQKQTPVQKRKPSQVKRPAQKQTPVQETKTKTITKTKFKPRNFKKNRLVPKKPKIPKLNISTSKTSFAGKLGEIQYKEGNRVRRIKTGLTYNRALKLASQVVDNTIGASMEVRAYGRTKKKDIKTPALKKFTVRKGKNPLVRRLVEKNKHRLDTKGEKNKINIARLIKKRLKK